MSDRDRWTYKSTNNHEISVIGKRPRHSPYLRVGDHKNGGSDYVTSLDARRMVDLMRAIASSLGYTVIRGYPDLEQDLEA